MNKTKKGLRITLYISVGFITALSVFLFVVCSWAKETFNVGLHEIMFTLKSPIKGSDPYIAINGIKECLPPVIGAIIFYIMLVIADVRIKNGIKVYLEVRNKKFSINVRKLFRKTAIILSVILLISSFMFVESEYSIIEFAKSRIDTTTIYEDYYVHPDSVNIRADGDEKNLICVYLESMETTYASNEDGGKQEVNYIPNLTRLANENISFSNSDKLGGFLTPNGATWTMGALMSATAGIPFSFPVEGNSMSLYGSFASGTVSLGDVLDKFGYNQYFLCGSDAEFGGRKQYFKQHGDYEIIDLFTAREEGYVPENYHVFWGFEDKYLYEIAKSKIMKAYETGKPFNFTMLTVDTHFPDGYVCDLCTSEYDSVAANVISCADRQINDFVNWCKEQPFYEDTVIVLIGDHPRMDTSLVGDVEFTDRRVYNCFINSSVEGEKAENREFTQLDLYPTTLSAMGFEFDNDRIGLGTDMFSGKQTLTEELGYFFLTNEFLKYSKYYIDNFS